MKYPNLKEENKLWKKGYECVAGLDEAGRGPLAGPVVAAAVTLRISKDKCEIKKVFSELQEVWQSQVRRGSLSFAHLAPVASLSQMRAKLSASFKIKNLKLRDSKKLSPKKREELYMAITRSPFIEWGVGRVSEKVIDRINIQNASELAMFYAVRKLKSKPNFLIIDGNRLSSKKLKTINHQLIVKADEKVLSCAIASILAKVTRDKIMKRYHKKYPQYGFNKHKGYPTKLHFKMLKTYGFCPFHRKSFRLMSED